MYRECFDIIASKLDEDSLFRLGVKLNLPYKDVDKIVDRGNSTYHKTCLILMLWRDQYGQQADLNQIVEILKEMNKVAIAKNLLKSFIHHRDYHNQYY